MRIATSYGMWLPSGTPRAIANRLYAETEKPVLAADTKDAFVAQGVDPAILPPDKFGTLFRADVEKWAKVAKFSGARAK